MEKETAPQETTFQRFKKTRTWAFIEIASPILGVIGAIVLPIALYVYSEKSGQITVRGIQKSSLIDAQNDIAKDVACTYGNTPIANITRFTLEVANTGNTDIGKEDIKYLRWIPPRSALILDAKVIGKTKDFGEFISLDYADQKALNLEVLALNKGVGATITILCSSNSLSIDSSTSRVEGVIKGATLIDHSSIFGTTQQPSFWASVFAGSIWANLVKVLIYSAIGLLILVLIAVPAAKLSEIRDRRQIRKAAEILVDSPEIEGSLKALEDAGIKMGEGERKRLAESVDFFRNLSPEQLHLCRTLVTGVPTGNYSDLLTKRPLSKSELDILRSIPNVNEFLSSIWRFQILYKPQEVIDVIEKRRL